MDIAQKQANGRDVQGKLSLLSHPEAYICQKTQNLTFMIMVVRSGELEDGQGARVLDGSSKAHEVFLLLSG